MKSLQATAQELETALHDGNTRSIPRMYNSLLRQWLRVRSLLPNRTTGTIPRSENQAGGLQQLVVRVY